MICHILAESNPMAPKYEIGQKVVITPVKPQSFTPRDADIEGYAGQSGQITDYYWVALNRGGVVYIYTVRVGDREVALHEDEVEAYIE